MRPAQLLVLMSFVRKGVTAATPLRSPPFCTTEAKKNPLASRLILKLDSSAGSQMVNRRTQKCRLIQRPSNDTSFQTTTTTRC